MTTLLALKNRKAVLRSCIEIERKADGAVSEKTFNDYETVLCHLIFAEAKLLKPFDRCARCKYLNERERIQ